MDHSRHARLNAAELDEAILQGAPIYGRDDSEISSVAYVYGEGENALVLFDVGGFLSIGSRRVALMAGQLDFMRDEDGNVHGVTQMTDDQLKALPEHTDYRHLAGSRVH